MDSFDDLMFEALDDTLRLMLGESVSKLIHAFTKKRQSLSAKKVSNEIEPTITYLEKLLGEEGTQIIRTASIKRLCSKLKQEYEEVEDHFLLLDQLYEMKFKLSASITDKKPEAYN
jgi:DNA-binding transcriptional regulator GbsR (MarR family)